MSDFNGKPFKEAMCIEAMRVFDSCSSQDCLEDLAFTFSEADQTVINAAAYIKSTCIDVTDVSFAISPVAFNHGFYAVDVTYTFRAQIEAYEAAGAAPTVVYGTSSFTKKSYSFWQRRRHTEIFDLRAEPDRHYLAYKRLLMLLLHSGNALRFCERSCANVS